MANLSLAFSRPWTLRVPLLTRQLEKQYLEAFFQDGSLRLSSFEVFRKHPDESRCDPQEGHCVIKIEAPNSKMSILGINGQEAYVMCASTVEKANLKDDKSGAFRILDTLGFANAISGHIPGFVGGYEGLCSYRDNTMLKKRDTRSLVPPKDGEDPQAWAENAERYVGKHTVDALFIKQSAFAHEAEYRFIWFGSGPKKDYLDIKCPDARRFCERVE